MILAMSCAVSARALHQHAHTFAVSIDLPPCCLVSSRAEANAEYWGELVQAPPGHHNLKDSAEECCAACRECASPPVHNTNARWYRLACGFPRRLTADLFPHSAGTRSAPPRARASAIRGSTAPTSRAAPPRRTSRAGSSGRRAPPVRTALAPPTEPTVQRMRTTRVPRPTPPFAASPHTLRHIGSPSRPDPCHRRSPLLRQ